MTVVFMGTPTFAVPSLEALSAHGFDILGVVTQPDRPKGRGKKMAPPPVKEKALSLGLKVYQPEKIKEPDFVDFLQRLRPDFIVVVAFGQILPKSILQIPKYGCINVHGSLLPKYRGAAPIHWAIINGEKKTGITTMLMDEGLDTGDMLLKETITITPNMTTGEAYDQLAQIGGQVLVDTLIKLKGAKIHPQRQNHIEASHAPLLKDHHELITWDEEALKIHNLIRGMNPWPGAYTFCKGGRLKIWESRLHSSEKLRIGQPGEILALDSHGLWVQTKDWPILITSVQPAGKKEMLARDFFNGYGVNLGDILGEDYA